MKITVVFDNYVIDSRLTAGWGFSCLVELASNNILFDTGGDGCILLDNMSKLGIDPRRVDALVLSHRDGDHTGGLASLLERSRDATVYLLRSFPEGIKGIVKTAGAKMEEVYAAAELVPGVYTTGELGEAIKEQSLVVSTGAGLVVITGCAHPGVASIIQKVKAAFPGENIHLVMGGFHLKSASKPQVISIIHSLKQMGVARAAPSHCSGDGARQLFKEQYGDDYIDSGAGKVISLP